MNNRSMSKILARDLNRTVGAKTAMTLALKTPDIVDNLISVDNAPVDVSLKSDFVKYTQAMRRIEDAGLKKQADADAILLEYEESLPIRQFLLTNLIRNRETSALQFRVPIKILAAALDNMGDFPHRDPDERRFEKPALFIRGTRSHYVADETIPVIGRFFPHFRLIDVDAGHWLISEKPDTFKEAVEEFLSEKG
ncbi:MAG: hypothetical protein M1814_000807 [Vezdaea aestivalis]|nr:MAG: hypothetical protein M1814_000807 [Vezdaea aestivalis]